MKKSRFLSVIAILVIVVTMAIGAASTASAQTVCSPATDLAVPVVLNKMGKFCWHTTTLCYNIISWYTTTLEINGIDYKQQYVVSSSIPPLNGGYTITFDGGSIPYAPGHLEITGYGPVGNTGPCNSVPPTSTPGGPTATFTRTPTNGPTATRTRTATNGPTATRTRTATNGPSLTATQTRTLTPVIPTLTPSPAAGTPTGGTCSPATTITTPFVKDGAGTFCWRISTLGFINSYNLTNLSVNGSNFLNMWAAAANLPPQIGGYWYISYTSATQFGHFEAQP